MEIATAHVDVEKLEARAKELLTAIIRGQPTIYTDMLRAEWRAVDAAIKSAWMRAYIKEYIRGSGFAPYIKKYDLPPDAQGGAIPMITRLIDWRRPGRTPH
jgi:hypothetical protein